MGKLIKLRSWEAVRYGHCLLCVYVDKIYSCSDRVAQWICKISSEELKPWKKRLGCKNYKRIGL
jgi:hypothetical protein